jgi:type IV pilus assembly protein PilN
MIRINLLAAERGPQKQAGAGPKAAPGALQAYLFLALFGGGALLGSAAFYWLKSSALKDLDVKIAAAEKRQKDLEAIKAQVQAFERKRAILDSKVALIERLKSQQTGPVHMLDEVSKALPEFLWLSNMDEGTAAGVTFKGEANGIPAVADFISNLQRSGWFPRVELVTTERDPKGLIKFTVSADFKNIAGQPASLASATAPTTSAPAAPAAPAAR